MAHGQPDYGMYSLAQTIYRLADMGELAVRLGSIVTHDRRGDVIWFDDFEGGVEKWIRSGGGIGHEEVWSSEAARFGDFSLKLTTGDLTDDYAQGYRLHAYPALSKLGFESSIFGENVLMEVHWQIEVDTGSDIYRFEIKLDNSTGTWAYLNSGGTYTNLSPAKTLYMSLPMFHIVKLVVDPESCEYVRLIVDDYTYDLSGLVGYKDGTTTFEWMATLVKVITLTDYSRTLHLDSAIGTQNEP